MSPQVKICGLTTPEAVRAAENADFLGFIFYPPSPRHLTLEQAALLSTEVRTRAVAVTVDADDEKLAAIHSQMKPSYFQLHGSESPGRVADIKARFSIPVIKAVAIASMSDIDAASTYENVADMLLFDAKPPSGLPGGNGAAFDWKLLAGFQSDTPWFLSGGLTRDTVEEAVRTTGAALLDVSSSLESSPGIKDPARVREFIVKVKGIKM